MSKKRERAVWYAIYKSLKKLGVLQDELVQQKIRLLGVASKEKLEQELLKYRKRQIQTAILGVIFLIFISAIWFFLQSSQDSKELSFERNSYGEGEKTESVYADGERIEFEVDEQKYRQNEIDAKFEEAFAYAEKNLLGENRSYDHITEDLNFSSMPDSGISISWMPRDYELIDSDGRVLNQDFSEEQKKGVMSSVVATFSYGDIVYEKEYPLCIYERKLTGEEAKKKD